jgi:ABC-type uncharacterized transport system substrate-binding protein
LRGGNVTVIRDCLASARPNEVGLQSLFAQAGILTRKVMQGAAISDLPVERPTRFKLITNLKTARLLGA